MDFSGTFCQHYHMGIFMFPMQNLHGVYFLSYVYQIDKIERAFQIKLEFFLRNNQLHVYLFKKINKKMRSLGNGSIIMSCLVISPSFLKEERKTLCCSIHVPSNIALSILQVCQVSIDYLPLEFSYYLLTYLHVHV